MTAETDGIDSDKSAFRELSEMLDRYLSLQISFIGILLMVVGYAVQFTDPAWTDAGVWTVVLFLWGLALFLLGTVVFLGFWWSHQGSGRPIS